MHLRATEEDRVWLRRSIRDDMRAAAVAREPSPKERTAAMWW